MKKDEPSRLGKKSSVLEEDEVLDVQVETPEGLEAEDGEESVPAGVRVYDWLMTSPVDRQPGWVCYLDGLVQQG